MRSLARSRPNLLIGCLVLLALFAAIAYPISAAFLPAPNRPVAPVIVDWTTETEFNTVGFNLYRGEKQEGPFEKINQNLIPALNNSYIGASYVYTDTQTIASVTYYYLLEDLDRNGVTTRHGPIVVTAARPFAFPVAWEVYVLLGLGAIALGGVTARRLMLKR